MMMVQENPQRAALVEEISAGKDYRDMKVKMLLMKKEVIHGTDPWAHYDYDADFEADPAANVLLNPKMDQIDIRVDSKKMLMTPINNKNNMNMMNMDAINKNQLLQIVMPKNQKVGMSQNLSTGSISTMADSEAGNDLDDVEENNVMVNGDGDDDIMDWVSKREHLVQSLRHSVDYRDRKVQELIMKKENKVDQMNPFIEVPGHTNSLITDERELYWAQHDYDTEYEFEVYVPKSKQVKVF